MLDCSIRESNKYHYIFTLTAESITMGGGSYYFGPAVVITYISGGKFTYIRGADYDLHQRRVLLLPWSSVA